MGDDGCCKDPGLKLNKRTDCQGHGHILMCLFKSRVETLFLGVYCDLENSNGNI